MRHRFQGCPSLGSDSAFSELEEAFGNQPVQCLDFTGGEMEAQRRGCLKHRWVAGGLGAEGTSSQGSAGEPSCPRQAVTHCLGACVARRGGGGGGWSLKDSGHM